MQNMQSQRMKAFIFFIILYVSWLPSWCEATTYEEGCFHENFYLVKCLEEGSGYATFTCLPETTNLTHVAWQRTGEITRCPKPNTACRCYEVDEGHWYDQGCECYNPAKPPKLPSIGVIRWNGSEIWAGPIGGEWVDSETVHSGEIHKNSNGHYMKKEWTSGKKSAASFEILIPDDNGRFTKFNGTGKKQLCKIDKDQPEYFLSSVWNRFVTDEHVSMTSEKAKKGKTSIQVWEASELVGMWRHWWTWTVKYDSEKDYAIPLKYNYRYYLDYWGEDRKSRTLDYNFQPITQEDQSFQLEDYCTNV